jgi:hypothetical protein
MTFLLVLCSSNVIRIQIGNPDFRILKSGSIIGPIKKKHLLATTYNKMLKPCSLLVWCWQAGRGEGFAGWIIRPAVLVQVEGVPHQVVQPGRCLYAWSKEL